MFVDFVETDLGWMALAGQERLLQRVVFGHASREAAWRAVVASCGHDVEQDDWFPQLTRRLARYAEGARESFDDIQIDVSRLSRFGQRVVNACRSIPAGETRTYGQLARASGSPAAARAVGNVMATNRFPLIVPCHRVVPAGGKLGRFSAPQGVAMKRRLLAMEGRSSLERRLTT